MSDKVQCCYPGTAWFLPTLAGGVHETKRARCLWEAKHARPAMWNCEVFPEVRLHYVHTIAPARAQEFRCQHITKFVAACCTVDFVSRNEH